MWNGNAFAKPLPGTIGNLTRNKLYGPGFGTVDVSVIKNVPITERVRSSSAPRCSTSSTAKT